MIKRSIARKRQQKALNRKKKKHKIALHEKQRQAKSYAFEHNAFERNGLPKLSETLLEFAKPILGDCYDRAFVENVIGMVITCWNIGTVEYHKAQEMREELSSLFSGDLHEDLPEDLEQELDLLIAFRRSVFQDDPRLIVEYDLSWNMVGDYHLQVMSTPLADEARFNPDDTEHFTAGLSSKTQEHISDLKTPPTEEQVPILELIEKGYELLHGKQAETTAGFSAICNLWLEAWEKVKALYQDTDSIHDIKPFSGIHLSNWCSNLETHLYDAGMKDPAYFDKRVWYCRDFCSEFPESQASYMRNMSRVEAESLFFSGHFDQGEAAFEKLVANFPDDAWSYIAWGDMYNGECIDLPVDMEKAERLYRIPIDRQLTDADVAEERLDSLKTNQVSATPAAVEHE